MAAEQEQQQSGQTNGIAINTFVGGLNQDLAKAAESAEQVVATEKQIESSNEQNAPSWIIVRDYALPSTLFATNGLNELIPSIIVFDFSVIVKSFTASSGCNVLKNKSKLIPLYASILSNSFINRF